jgi:tripartite-type tricarboxylate transporter receptor subunit TctC
MGPAGMPKELLDKLNAEINEVLKSPEAINRLSATGGLAIVGGSSAKFGELLTAELAKWKAHRAAFRRTRPNRSER